ncbi:hypothetical protein F4803DRAFT_296098 [Xylaria telfairii]|nr:hypothetical protein F4803DRAFT_296098 [Xylaria telfairii]
MLRLPKDLLPTSQGVCGSGALSATTRPYLDTITCFANLSNAKILNEAPVFRYARSSPHPSHPAGAIGGYTATQDHQQISARLAQSVERETLNLKVAGSTPASGSIPDASQLTRSSNLIFFSV